MTRRTHVARLALAAAMLVGACADGTPQAAPAPYAPSAAHPVTVTRPAGPPRVKTSLVDPLGRPVTIGCATCHSLGDLGDPERRTSPGAPPLAAMHGGLAVAHGDLTCRSCHAAPDYAALRRADGDSLPFSEVQALCSQCHGPQARDFDRGMHGGMNGYWDLSRGPRLRHTCTTCHDPHAPAYVGMHPARGPVDPRFGKGH